MKKTKIFIMLALAMSLMLGGCGTVKKIGEEINLSATKSITYDVEDGEKIEVTVSASSGLKLPLKSDENNQFVLKMKDDEDFNSFFLFMPKDGYLTIMEIVENAGYETETSRTLVEDEKITVYRYEENGISAAIFWIPNGNYGILLSAEESEGGNIETLLNNMTFGIIGDADGIEDPFTPSSKEKVKEETVEESEEQNVENNEINFGESDEKKHTEDNPSQNTVKQDGDYWTVQADYEETYSCEYFKSYEGKDCNIQLYYEPEMEVVQAVAKAVNGETVDTISIYNNIQMTDVTINGNLLAVIRGESNSMYKYYVISADGSKYMEISSIYGDNIDNTLVEVIGDFIN